MVHTKTAVKVAPELVQVPVRKFLMTDGRGDPNVAARDAIELLYKTSYRIKFALRRARGLDYKVAPLEGLWWVPDMRKFSVGHKSDWLWTLMIRQPDEVDEEFLDELGIPSALRFESFAEGLAAQLLHVGPYSEEGPSVERLHEFIADQGYRPVGKHHEIYLGDPRRAAPSKLRTVLRQPVEPLRSHRAAHGRGRPADARPRPRPTRRPSAGRPRDRLAPPAS